MLAPLPIRLLEDRGFACTLDGLEAGFAFGLAKHRFGMETELAANVVVVAVTCSCYLVVRVHRMLVDRARRFKRNQEGLCGLQLRGCTIEDWG